MKMRKSEIAKMDIISKKNAYNRFGMQSKMQKRLAKLLLGKAFPTQNTTASCNTKEKIPESRTILSLILEALI